MSARARGFDRFDRVYGASRVRSPAGPWSSGDGSPWLHPDFRTVRGYDEFASRYAGATFGGGVYRFHDATSGPRGQELIEAAFPQFRSDCRVFGYDWLGRQYLIDLQRIRKGHPLVLLLDPDGEEALDVPSAFEEFHRKEIFDEPEAALELSLFHQWAESHPDQLPLARESCVGTIQPCALGGDLTLDNLQVTLIEVHWEMTSQLSAAVSDLPEGTSILSVRIDDEDGG